jgi:hypothetical protein
MKTYMLTVRVRFEAADDLAARERLPEVRPLLVPVYKEDVVREEALQEVFNDKAPRKVNL